MKYRMIHWLGLVVASLLLTGTMIASAPHAAAASITVGVTTIEPSTDSDPAGMAEAFKATASTSGTVAALYVYLDSSSQTTNLVAGL